MEKRLNVARQHAWNRWHREYIHSFMESHRVVKVEGKLAKVGKIVLVLEDKKISWALEKGQSGEPHFGKRRSCSRRRASA